jgi:hypothetical protein
LKRFTSRVVSKWITAANLIRKVRQPKPFPGKAPTRIMLNAITSKRSFAYIGKPSHTAYVEFTKFINKPVVDDNNYIVYVEFDRGGIITYSKSGMYPAKRQTNETLWQYYHPDLFAENWPNWLRYPYKVMVDGHYKIV